MENNILVKFAVYNTNVNYDVYEDTLLLFDNTSLIEKIPLPNLIFTGIKLSYNKAVKLICYDKDLNKIKHSFWKGYLFLEFDDVDICICSIKFVPKEAVNFIDEFKPHFLEVDSESI